LTQLLFFVRNSTEHRHDVTIPLVMSLSSTGDDRRSIRNEYRRQLLRFSWKNYTRVFETTVAHEEEIGGQIQDRGKRTTSVF